MGGLGPVPARPRRKGPRVFGWGPLAPSKGTGGWVEPRPDGDAPGQDP